MLIAAKPSRMRGSLHTLLRTVPGIGAIAQADNSAAAVHMTCACPHALIVLDTNLPGATLSDVLREIRAEGVHSRCLVLVADAHQRRCAIAAGADVALLKGYTAAQLFEAVEKLMEA